MRLVLLVLIAAFSFGCAAQTYQPVKGVKLTGGINSKEVVLGVALEYCSILGLINIGGYLGNVLSDSGLCATIPTPKPWVSE